MSISTSPLLKYFKGIFFCSSISLLRIAAFLWLTAGIILTLRSANYLIGNQNYILIKLIAGLTGGFLFYRWAFEFISIKHIQRILRKDTPRHFFLAFFDVKTFLLMVLMIGFGLMLSITGLVPEDILYTFFLIMGLPLIISSFRFFNASFKRQQTLYLHIDTKKSHKRFKRLMLAVPILFVLMVVMAISSYFHIRNYSSRYSYNEYQIKELPVNEAAIVLGTSQFIRKGRPNLYFHYRIKAAAELYLAGKIKYLILSGDNSHLSYNEPVSMKKALIRLGVPDSVIYLDYAGFRTLDSMVRAKEIFGQKKVTVVSQGFHNHRAIYLARHFGIEAWGFNAEDVNSFNGFKTILREYLARINVFLDIYILNTKPKFLGKPVILGEKQIN